MLAEHVPRDARPRGVIRADPNSKLVAMCLPSGDALALIPFVQELELDTDHQQDEGLAAATRIRQPYAPSFVLPLADLDAAGGSGGKASSSTTTTPIANVIDLCFLHGFHDPVLAILHEPQRTWVGRRSAAAGGGGGARVEIRTIDALARSYPALASVDTLPLGFGDDALYLSAVPTAAGGGILVVSANGITHVDGSGRSLGVAVNGWPSYTHKSEATTSAASKWAHLELDLAGSHIAWVGGGGGGGAGGRYRSIRGALLVLADGDAYSLRLELDGRSVTGMRFEHVVAGIKVARPTSLSVNAQEDAVFVGSATGPSEVWRCVWQEVERDDDAKEETKPDVEMEDGDDIDDDDLYADSIVKTDQGGGGASGLRSVDVRLTLVREDLLLDANGAVVDFAFGVASSEEGGRRPLLSLLGPTRVGTLSPGCFDRQTLDWPGTEGARHVWSMEESIVVALEDRTQVYQVDPEGDVEMVAEHQIAAVACDRSEKGDLTLLGSDRVLVINGAMLVKEIKLDGSVVSGCVARDWLLVHLEDGHIRLFHDLEHVDAPFDAVTTACLYRDSHLCTTRGQHLEIRALPSLDVIFTFDGLEDCPAQLINRQSAAAHATSDDDEDKDTLIACQLHDLAVPTLTLLFSSGELAVYESNTPIHSSARFIKTLARTLPSSRSRRALKPLEEDQELLITGTISFVLSRDRQQSVRLTSIDMDLFSLANHHGHYIAVTQSHVASLLRHHPSSHRLPRDYTHLTFDPASGLYVAAAAIQTRFQLYSDECEMVVDPEAPHLTPPCMERSTLELLDADFRAMDGYDFGENEVVLAVESVTLEATSSASGIRRFIAVGTSVNRGEDMSSKGHTYIFEVVPVVDTGHRLRLICSEDGAASVTALSNVGPYLVHAIGQKVYVKALDREDRLVPVAFLDVGAHVTSLRAFKNLLLIGDFIKSTWLCAFQEDPFKLEVLSKDVQDVSTVSVDFMTSAEGHRAAFVATDREGVCRVLEYDPEHASNERLIRRAEYNLGAAVTRSSLVARRGRAAGEVDGVPGSQLLLSASDGSLSTLVPVRAARFKRLQLLQAQLLRSIPHVAGLNPRSNRTVANELYARPLNRGILDGPLLRAFELLPRHRQREICEPIGTTRETVLNDLVELAGLGSAWTWSF